MKTDSRGYVSVPKDLNAVKTKVIFSLTKRQLICFGSGVLAGLPLFFLLRNSLGNGTAAICMISVMLPFFMFAMYERNGQPLEKLLLNMREVCFVRPKRRPYIIKNTYNRPIRIRNGRNVIVSCRKSEKSKAKS